MTSASEVTTLWRCTNLFIIFFVFPKVKWLHLTGEMDKSVDLHVKFSQDFTCQKSLKSVNI